MRLNLEVLENGNLKISFDESDREELEEMLEEKTELDIFMETTEDYWTNGSYHPFDAASGNPFVGLIDTICIAENLNHYDDGSITVEGSFWYDPHYVLRNSVVDMLDNGFVIFLKGG